MSSFLDKCEEYFESRDFYEILKVKRDVSEKELKKAYHKLSLLVHPDRVEEKNKLEATEKFKVLGKIHSILQDEEKRKIYDESGEFDDEDSESGFNWMNYWRSLFKPITIKDIENYKNEYIGSETELRDIKKAYVNSSGNMDHIYEMVSFCNLESEPRIKDIVRKLIDDGEVEEYDCFFNEPKRKFEKRKKKLEKEKEEAESLNVDDSELEKEIQKNHEKRESNFFNFLNKLEDKYGNKNSAKKRKMIEGGSSKITPSKKRTTRSSKK